MPTAGKTTYRNINDGIGRGSVSFYDFTLATGITANIGQKLFSSIALTATREFSRESEIEDTYDESIQINRIWFDQAPLGFSFVIGYRFGGRKE